MKPFKNWSEAKTWAYKHADDHFCFLSWYKGEVVKMRMEPYRCDWLVEAS